MKKTTKLMPSIIAKKILSNDFFYQWIYHLLKVQSRCLRQLPDYRNIYIDVSIIAKNDNKTGIQRVVKEIIYQLLTDTNFRHKLRFVMASKKLGYREVKISNSNNINFDISTIDKYTPTVSPSANDLFLGLDLSLKIVPEHILTLMKWRYSGVTIAWVIYDLLPIHHPQWFTESITVNFSPWLKTVLLTGDIFLCISKEVARQLNEFAHTFSVTINSQVISLGANFKIDNSIDAHWDNKCFENDTNISLPYGQYILVVGTLEPRKGHLDIINAIETLWLQNKTNFNLVIVGKQGWQVEQLIKRIKKSSFYLSKLFWLNDVTEDTILKKLYHQSCGVVISSYAEGYGLPLIEALLHHKPVFARDINIFREVAKDNKLVYFFPNDERSIAKELENWLSKLNTNCDNTQVKNVLFSSTNDSFEIISWNNCKESIIQAFIDSNLSS